MGDIADAVLPVQAQVTEVRVKIMVLETFIRSWLETLPEEQKNAIEQRILKSFLIDTPNPNTETLKIIATNYLEQTFHIR